MRRWYRDQGAIVLDGTKWGPDAVVISPARRGVEVLLVDNKSGGGKAVEYRSVTGLTDNSLIANLGRHIKNLAGDPATVRNSPRDKARKLLVKTVNRLMHNLPLPTG